MYEAALSLPLSILFLNNFPYIQVGFISFFSMNYLVIFAYLIFYMFSLRNSL